MNNVGDGLVAGNAKWSFDGETANNFEDHVSKSVPFYDEGHNLICQLSDYFVKSDTAAYELGCSTGILSKKLAERHSGSGRFIGIDSVEKMIDFARRNYSADNLVFDHADCLDYEYEEADLFTSYYLMQFISPSARQQLINIVYENLKWGGAFIMFEKVRAPDARFQDICTGLYSDYKLTKGYSPEEIVGKARSLKGVLEPFSTYGNLGLLERAGFSDICIIFKYICFEGYLCIK